MCISQLISAVVRVASFTDHTKRTVMAKKTSHRNLKLSEIKEADANYSLIAVCELLPKTIFPVVVRMLPDQTIADIFHENIEYQDTTLLTTLFVEYMFHPVFINCCSLEFHNSMKKDIIVLEVYQRKPLVFLETLIKHQTKVKPPTPKFAHYAERY